MVDQTAFEQKIGGRIRVGQRNVHGLLTFNGRALDVENFTSQFKISHFGIPC